MSEAANAGDDSPGHLGASLAQSLATEGITRKYPRGAVLLNEYERGDTLYIILKGRVKVYAGDENGKEVVIATHGVGEYFGELALDGGSRSASVVTLEPTTCSLVSGAQVRAFIGSHPDFAWHLCLKLIWRVRQATERIKILALKNSYGRVVYLLHELSDPVGAQRVVREHLTQQDIADRVGASREMVNRVLGDLERNGFILRNGGTMTIVKKLPVNFYRNGA